MMTDLDYIVGTIQPQNNVSKGCIILKKYFGGKWEDLV